MEFHEHIIHARWNGYRTKCLYLLKRLTFALIGEWNNAEGRQQWVDLHAKMKMWRFAYHMSIGGQAVQWSWSLSLCFFSLPQRSRADLDAKKVAWFIKPLHPTRWFFALEIAIIW
jgi:hypothetical protein